MARHRAARAAALRIIPAQKSLTGDIVRENWLEPERERSSAAGINIHFVVSTARPWRHLEAVELATLKWVDWFNHRRLLEPIGTCRRPKKNRCMIKIKSGPRWPDSQQGFSDNPRVVQSTEFLPCTLYLYNLCT